MMNQEHPRAYVILKPKSKNEVKFEDIYTLFTTRAAPHKWLAGGIVFVEAVPSSASGKILRKVLREWAKRDAARMDPGRDSK